ncbi:hypothetical protein ACFL59_05975 [Planctomycetota bacterium]
MTFNSRVYAHGDLMIPDNRKLHAKKDVHVGGLLRLGSGAEYTQTAGYTYYEGVPPDIKNGTYGVPMSYVDGDLVLGEQLVLPTGSSVTILADRSLDLASNTLEVGGDFVVQHGGTTHRHLRMTEPQAKLLVHGNSTFGGRNTLAEGTVELRGNLTQSGDARSLEPVNTSFVLSGSDLQTVYFANSGLSYVNDLEVTGAGPIRLSSNVEARGQLRSPAAAIRPMLTSPGKQLTTQGLDVDGLVLEYVLLSVGSGAIDRFDNVELRGYNAGVKQIALNWQSKIATFSGLVFRTAPTSGYYIYGTDSSGTSELTIAGSQPLYGLPKTGTSGDFTIHWGTGNEDTDGDGVTDAQELQDGTDPITPDSMPADHLLITATPDPVTAGGGLTVTVSPRDSYDRPDRAFAGTVTLTSTDAAASINRTHAYTTGDEGTHDFVITLLTGGQQVVTASTTGLANNTATAGVTVDANPNLKVWKGGAAGVETWWSASSNWEPTGIPDSSSDVLVSASAAHQPVLNGNVMIRGLRTENGAQLNTAGYQVSASGDVRAASIAGGGSLVLTGASKRLTAFHSGNLTILGSVTVDGDSYVSGTLYVAPGKSVSVGTCTFTIGGNMNLDGDQVYSAKQLQMTVPQSRLVVHGDAVFEAPLQLTAGLIELKGAFTQQRSFQPAGTKVVFSGTLPQGVYFQRPGAGAEDSFFGDVTVGSGSTVAFSSSVTVKGKLVVDSGATLSQSAGYSTTYYDSSLPDLSDTGTYAVPNSIVGGFTGISMDKDYTFPATGNLAISQESKLALGPHTLTVGGNLTVDGHATYPGYRLQMIDSAARLLVHGDTVFYGSPQLTAGVMELRSDLRQELFAVQAPGTLVILNGTAGQELYFQRPGIGSSDSYLGNLEIAATGGVTLLSNVHLTGQLRSPAGVNPVVAGGGATLVAAGLDVDGLVLENVLLSVGNGTVSRFDNVQLKGYQPDASQITIARDTLDATFSNLTFSSTPVGGLYVSALDTDGAATTARLEISQSMPLYGIPKTKALNDFQLLWGGAQDDTDGDGKTDAEELAVVAAILWPVAVSPNTSEFRPLLGPPVSNPLSVALSDTVSVTCSEFGSPDIYPAAGAATAFGVSETTLREADFVALDANGTNGSFETGLWTYEAGGSSASIQSTYNGGTSGFLTANQQVASTNLETLFGISQPVPYTGIVLFDLDQASPSIDALAPELTVTVRGDGTLYGTPDVYALGVIRVRNAGNPIAAAANRLSVSVNPSPAVSGQPLSLTVSAVAPPLGIPDMGFKERVRFSSNDPVASLPQNYTFDPIRDAGTHVFQAVLNSTGPQTITVRSLSSGIMGTSTVTVEPGAVASLEASGLPGTIQAGSAASLTVRVLDPSGNVATGFDGEVTVASTDGAADLPPAYTFVPATDRGVHIFTITLNTAGPQTVAVTSPAVPAGVAVQTTVTAGDVAALRLSGLPSLLPAGATATLTVTAVDGHGNRVTSFAETVSFTSTDGNAHLPADTAFGAADQGERSFAVNLRTAGTQRITATATVGQQTITGEQQTTVTSGTFGGLAITAPGAPVLAGASATVSVAATDGNGNEVPDFDGTVQFFSTDPLADLPATYTFVPASDQGGHNFTITPRTAGTQTVIVKTLDLVGGDGASLTVTPAAATSIKLTGLPDAVVAGATHTVTVTAYDEYGNRAAGFDDTVHFDIPDAQATIPGDHSFDPGVDAGKRSFVLALATAPTQSVSVSSTPKGLSDSKAVTVTPGNLEAFLISGLPSSIAADVQATPTMTAIDAFSNTVRLVTTDGAAELPTTDSFTLSDGGARAFNVKFGTVGAHTVTVASAEHPATGTATTNVLPSVQAASLEVAVVPNSVDAGTTAVLTVTARDRFGNVAVGFDQKVWFSSTDAHATLPPFYTFSPAGDQGSHSFSIQLHKPGEQSVFCANASEEVRGAGTVTVNPGSEVVIDLSNTQTQATAGSNMLYVAVRDGVGDYLYGFSGTIGFSTTQSGVALPPDFTFSPVDPGLSRWDETVMGFSPKAWWRLNEASGSTTAHDASQNGYDGQYTGNVSLDQTGAFDQQANWSVQLNPSTPIDGYVLVDGDQLDMGTKSFTVIIWFNKTSSSQAAMKLFNKGESQSGTPVNVGYAMRIWNGVLEARLRDETKDVTVITQEPTVGVWHFAAMTVDRQAGKLRLYLDPEGGAPATTADLGALGSLDTNLDLALGALDRSNASGDSSEFFEGYLDEVAMFETALSGGQIQSLYDSVTEELKGIPEHVFPVVLRQATPTSVTVTDLGSGANSDVTYTVSPGTAAAFEIAGPGGPVTAGGTELLGLTVRDQFGNVAASYSGTVELTSSDGAASLPSSYTFDPVTDQGSHTFPVTLRTAGSQTATVASSDQTITADTAVDVRAASAVRLTVTGIPDPIPVGGRARFTVTALDAEDNVDTSFTEQVEFLSSDTGATLPTTTTFASSDAGLKTFEIVFGSVATQTVTARRVTDQGVMGEQTVYVDSSPPGPGAGTWSWWTGGVSTSWSDSANWSLGTVPDKDTNAYVDPTPVNQPVLAGDVSVRWLNVDTGARLDSNGHTISVNAQAWAHGEITGTGTVYMRSGGIVSGRFPNLESAFNPLELAGPVHVRGNLESEKRLSVFGYRLEVDGDFTTPNHNSITILHMDSGSPYVIIGGTATFGAPNVLSHGTLELRGGLVQRYYNKALQVSGTRFLFAGTSTQTVSFAHPGTGWSYLHDVDIADSTEVTFASDVVVKGQLTLGHGARLTQSAPLGVNFTAKLPDVLKGTYDVDETRVGFAGESPEIALDRDITLPASTDLEVQVPSKLNLAGRTLVVRGDFRIQPSSTSSSAHLALESASTKLVVYGHTTLAAKANLLSGTMELYGGLTQSTDVRALEAGSSLKFVFAGAATQTVTVASGSSYFQDVELEPGADVTFASDVAVRGQLTLGAGATLRQSEPFATSYSTAFPKGEDGDYRVATTRMNGEITLAQDHRLPVGASVIVPANKRLILDGHTLVVGGDLTETQPSAGFNQLQLANANDLLVVHGNLTLAGDTVLTAGLVKVYGDLTQETVSTAIDPTGTRFELCGTSTQTVTFAHSASNQSFFNNLLISNPAGVTFDSNVLVKGLLQLERGARVIQAKPLTTTFTSALPIADGGSWEVAESKLGGSMTLTRDHTLTPAGGLTVLPSKSLTLAGHQLTIGGDLRVENPSSSFTHLQLNNAADRLIVLGSATFVGRNSLSAGRMELRGDLVQQGDATALQSAGTETVLNGTSTQSVSFQNPATSYLSDVTVVNRVGVSFDTSVRVTGKLTLAEGAVLTQGGADSTSFTAVFPSVAAGSYQVPNTRIAGFITLTEDHALPPGSSVTIVSGNQLTVGGNRLRRWLARTA